MPIEPELLFQIANQICDLIEEDLDVSEIDYIIAPEAMALPIATMVSDMLDKPFIVARKRKYGLPRELEVHQVTGYSKSLIYINSITSNHNVIIIDDVVSTGGTMSAIIDTLENHHVNVLGSYVIIEKNGATKNLRDQGYNVNSLVNVIIGKDRIENVSQSN